MIAELIKSLQADDFYGVSKEMEIAKGKYELLTNYKQFVKQIKRFYKYEKIQNSLRRRSKRAD